MWCPCDRLSATRARMHSSSYDAICKLTTGVDHVGRLLASQLNTSLNGLVPTPDSPQNRAFKTDTKPTSPSLDSYTTSSSNVFVAA